MQVSLKQWISPGFYGRMALFDLYNVLTLKINHKKTWRHSCASCKIHRWGNFMVCVFPLECFKELDFCLFAEHSSSCVSFALHEYWKKLLVWKLLNTWDNCTKHFTVCIVLSHYFTQSFVREARDILFTYFRKRNRGIEEIRESWQGNLSHSGMNQQIKMSSFRSFTTYD